MQADHSHTVELGLERELEAVGRLRCLTTVGADRDCMEAAAAPPHLVECHQHNPT